MSTDVQLLKDLLQASLASPEGVKEARFRADHPNEQAIIDKLVSRGRIQRRASGLILRPLAVADLAPHDTLAADLLAKCQRVFDAVRSRVIADPEGKIFLRELADQVQIPHDQLVPIVEQLMEVSIWSTHYGNLSSDEAYVVANVSHTLRFLDYEAVLKQFRDWAENSTLPAGRRIFQVQETTPAPNAIKPKYVDASRITDLRVITPLKWDLTRLIRLCEELNEVHERELWMACAMLVRSIVDHVPPIFGQPNFASVASQYPATRSLQKQMKHLESSLRPIADSHLHLQVRSREVLPTFIQVDFRADLDALLGEIIRILK